MFEMTSIPKNIFIKSAKMLFKFRSTEYRRKFGSFERNYKKIIIKQAKILFCKRRVEELHE